MSINTHDQVPQHTPYPHYDHILTTDQKLLLQQKINDHAPLLAAIDEFCEQQHVKKEELYDISCKLFFVAQKSQKDPRRIAQMQYLPTREKRFGIERGKFMYEHIVMNIYTMLYTLTHSRKVRKVSDESASALISLFQKNKNIDN